MPLPLGPQALPNLPGCSHCRWQACISALRPPPPPPSLQWGWLLSEKLKHTGKAGSLFLAISVSPAREVSMSPAWDSRPSVERCPAKPPLSLSSPMSLLILTGHDHLFQRSTSPGWGTCPLQSVVLTPLSHLFCPHTPTHLSKPSSRVTSTASKLARRRGAPSAASSPAVSSRFAVIVDVHSGSSCSLFVPCLYTTTLSLGLIPALSIP